MNFVDIPKEDILPTLIYEDKHLVLNGMKELDGMKQLDYLEALTRFY